MAQFLLTPVACTNGVVKYLTRCDYATSSRADAAASDL